MRNLFLRLRSNYGIVSKTIRLLISRRSSSAGIDPRVLALFLPVLVVVAPVKVECAPRYQGIYFVLKYK